jgi:hypothetical protein
MSQSKRNGWLLLAAGLAGLLLVVLLTGQHLSTTHTSRLSCCVKDGTTGGGLAVARWAERLGYRVQPLAEPLWEAVKKLNTPTGNLVITAGNHEWSPWGRDIEDVEWASVRAWVRKGNTLLVMTGAADELPEPVRRDLLGVRGKTAAPPGISGIPLARWFEQGVDPKSPTSTVTLPSREQLVVRSNGPRLKQTPEGDEVVSDGSGVVLSRRTEGQGSIYLLADDFAWVNAGFDRPENARALAAMLRRELRGGVLGFDEYRHGHGRVESFGTFLAALPGATTFLWIAALLTVLYLYGRNVRFGPPEPHELPERRTAREYIEAVAYLCQRARAAPLTVDAVVRRIRHLAQQRGHLTPEAQRVLHQAEQYGSRQDRPATPYEACELVAALVRMRKHLYGS